MWFDKYCIDQTNIEESVRRLPVFVVASSKFLVLLGPVRTSRLVARSHHGVIVTTRANPTSTHSYMHVRNRTTSIQVLRGALLVYVG